MFSWLLSQGGQSLSEPRAPILHSSPPSSQQAWVGMGATDWLGLV